MPIVVVVDDRRINLKILSKLAGSLAADIIVHAFADPVEALDWTASNCPDLCITDFKMPVLDGAAFIRRFRAQPDRTHVPVVVVTAFDDARLRRQALEAGADDFLLGPVDPLEFRARVRTLLTLRRQHLLLRGQGARATVARCRDLVEVLDTVPAMVSATGPDGRYQYVNRTYAAALGVTAERAVGRSPADLLPRDGGTRAMALDRRVAARGEPMTPFEEEVEMPDGVCRTLVTLKTPVRDRAGTIVRIVTVSMDVTARARTGDGEQA
ncbi:response regulator [Skermanella pratensis]|uniref:response regulator n=1 Tax=Skermanella pratensis TaxID=2233999 RepID=UPI00130119D4|nr:response regulator [Skermanella pratensis]